MKAEEMTELLDEVVGIFDSVYVSGIENVELLSSSAWPKFFTAQLTGEGTSSVSSVFLQENVAQAKAIFEQGIVETLKALRVHAARSKLILQATANHLG